MALNPIAYTENIINSFLKYQLTTYPLADSNLYQQLRALRTIPTGPHACTQAAPSNRCNGLAGIICQRVTRAACQKCGWQRKDSGLPVTTQTINHDHTVLTHMLNVARSPRFKLIQDNPASHVEKPDPKNERDRIASVDEWLRLKATAAPHLRRLLIVAHAVGPRRGELLKLEWPDVDMRRKEFTLRKTKNGDTRVVPMTDEVCEIFVELWRERRLDTNRIVCFCIKGRLGRTRGPRLLPPAGELELAICASTTFGTPRVPICAGQGLIQPRL